MRHAKERHLKGTAQFLGLSESISEGRPSVRLTLIAGVRATQNKVRCPGFKIRISPLYVNKIFNYGLLFSCVCVNHFELGRQSRH